jgi:hypothetical protein
LFDNLLKRHVGQKPCDRAEKLKQKTIDQKKRAVKTRPFGREADIVAG